MSATPKCRARYARDGRWLRRARRHYCGMLRRWAEQARSPVAFRERVWIIGRAMLANGLLAGGGPHLAAHTVISCWKRDDRMPFWPWIHADERREVAIMYERQFQGWLEYELAKKKKVKRA